MIHSVTANKESFHSVTFTSGLNLIVADKSTTATDQNSRNGLGKSTLFRIIDFCLGADPNKEGTLPAKYLPTWEFTVSLDLRGQRVAVTRAVDDDKIVKISADIESWPIKPDTFSFDNLHTYTIDEWRKILGWALFDLPNVSTTNREDMIAPSFRQLFQFFIRKKFDNPLLPSAGTVKAESLPIAYLLGLNWEYLSRLALIEKTELEAKTVQSAAKIQLREWEKTEKALRAECNAAESNMKRIKEQLADFNVLPGYEEIEKRVNNLTLEIHGLKNLVITEQNRLQTAKRQLDKARAALLPVEELYAEVGFAFPDAVKERLDAVKRFHESVSGNRRVILTREIKTLEKTISTANEKILAKSEEKRTAMQILKTHNALSEYTALNQRYTELGQQLQRKLDCLHNLQQSKANLLSIKEQKTSVAEEARLDFEELRPTWNESENYFRALTQQFYGVEGSLNIQLTGEKRKWGFTFDPRIASDDSEGIKKAKIFAFDLTLFHQQQKCDHPINFLIHDSVVFDSTDPRQVANAMKKADTESRAFNGQYICAINSEKLDLDEFKEILPRNQSLAFTRLTLSDASDQDKLLGISFGPKTILQEPNVPLPHPEPDQEG